MRFGLDVAQPRLEWPEIRERVRFAEHLGFDGVWGFDHFESMYGEGLGNCVAGMTTLADPALGAYRSGELDEAQALGEEALDTADRAGDAGALTQSCPATGWGWWWPAGVIRCGRSRSSAALSKQAVSLRTRGPRSLPSTTCPV
jgi:hypothetical protein